MPTDRSSAKKGEHILIVCMADTRGFLLSLGGFKAIRDHHPRALITALVDPAQVEIANLCPYIDHTSSGYAGAARPQRAGEATLLRKSGFAHIYDFDSNERSEGLAKAMKSRFGAPPPWHSAPQLEAGTHFIDRLGALLERAGVEMSTARPVPDLHWVRALMGNPPRLKPEFFGISPPYAVITLDGGDEAHPRFWSVAQVADLCHRLSEGGLTPVLCGNKGAGPIAQKVEMQARETKNMVARGDTMQMISLAETAAVIVGPDTAPLQVGGIFARPTLLLAAMKVDTPDAGAPLAGPTITIRADTLGEIGTDTVFRAISMWNVLPNANPDDGTP